MQVFVEGIDDGADLLYLLPVEVGKDGAVPDGDLCVVDLPAEIGEQFNFGLRGGHITDLFGGGAEDLAEGFFREVEVGFWEFGEAFVHFLLYGGDKVRLIGGFEEEVGEEFFVVFFKFGEAEAEFGKVGGGEVFQFGFELLDGGGSHGGKME